MSVSTWFENSTVAIVKVEACYPSEVPFHPAEHYPESIFAETAKGSNPAYEGVRRLFFNLGLDHEAFGTPAWNPLGDLVSPGDSVLIKPNLIRESHVFREEQWIQIVTHGSLIRAILDYVFIALKGKGKVIVADGPQTDSDFEEICSRNGLFSVVEFFRSKGLPITLLDLRRDRWFQNGDVIYKRVSLPGDPSGYTTVELGELSEFTSYRGNGNFYGADYDRSETATFHNAGRHAYVLCRSVIDADVVINVPKLKTHKKTGVTISLKNMVGINGYRNCLPHHTVGTPDVGGDEFDAADLSLKLQSRLVTGFKSVLRHTGGRGGTWARLVKRAGVAAFGDNSHVVRSGNWHGNDTAWRMVLDLNHALFHFDGEGKTRKRPLRYLSIVDGIVAGEGDGPMAADEIAAGLLVAGFNPAATDTVCAALMDFDYRKIPMLASIWKSQPHYLAGFDLAKISCRSDVESWNGSFEKIENAPHIKFRPHFGWSGEIERSSPALVTSAK
jgi:uncharacterized protein (DUF362 family)